MYHTTGKSSCLWWVTRQQQGASALGLQRVLRLGSSPTAWTWLHKLRRGMVRPGRDRLTGRVEVAATDVGGEQQGVREAVEPSSTVNWDGWPSDWPLEWLGYRHEVTVQGIPSWRRSCHRMSIAHRPKSWIE